jgi:hypothetical protein
MSYALIDRRLQALRHREGVGKNWRSHRRGCERRFAFQHPHLGGYLQRH